MTAAAGLFKSFSITGKLRMRLEGTFTNILNHPNFYPPSTFVNSPISFGKTTAVQSQENSGTLTDSYRFGDISYAKEELRAELASVFLAAERGVPHDPEQHAAYVSSWINVLKKDKNEIFRAAHDASRAADFLLALVRDRPLLHSTELGDPRNVSPEGETENSEHNRRDREAVLAPSAGSAGRAPNGETLRRARTTGRGR